MALLESTAIVSTSRAGTHVRSTSVETPQALHRMMMNLPLLFVMIIQRLQLLPRLKQDVMLHGPHVLLRLLPRLMIEKTQQLQLMLQISLKLLLEMQHILLKVLQRRLHLLQQLLMELLQPRMLHVELLPHHPQVLILDRCQCGHLRNALVPELKLHDLQLRLQQHLRQCRRRELLLRLQCLQDPARHLTRLAELLAGSLVLKLSFSPVVPWLTGLMLRSPGRISHVLPFCWNVG